MYFNPWVWSGIFVILLQAVEKNGGSPTWPYGYYTLLKPRTGCPEGWHDKGYLHQDTIDKNPSNNKSETLHIDGIVACSHVKRYFCSKTNKNGVRWPSGQYCVYRRKNKRLHRMRMGSILMYGEKNNNQDEYKAKFYASIKKSMLWNYEYTRLYFTCRTQGNKKIPISLPITKPFYLLPYGSRDCQQVKWMVATSEWIKYHTRNYITKSSKQTYGTVPYHELGKRNHQGITMYYCYYRSCNPTLNDTSGVFQSPGFPGQYPDGQLCSWRIMVPDNHTLRVHFTHFNLDENDTLKYFKSLNGSCLRSWCTISLLSVPFTLSSDSDVLFVFRSDESNTSTGFRAEYRVFIPQATTAPTDVPTTASHTTVLTTSTIPTSEKTTSSTKPTSSIMNESVKSAETTSTPDPAPQHSKSNAETLRSSSFSSRNTAITVVVVSAVCALIGIILLILVIYQCRYRRTRSRAKSSARGAEGIDRAVMNPTYDREAMLLKSPNCTPEYENVECERSKKANPKQNPKTSEVKNLESFKESGHYPLYHVSELHVHDPKSRECPSQIEGREPEVVNDGCPSPLYHVLEGPDPISLSEVELDEDQSNSRSREEEVNDSSENPLYQVLEAPSPNNQPKVELDEDQFSSTRPMETEAITDSGPNPLYHALEGPDSYNVGMADAQTYEDIDS